MLAVLLALLPACTSDGEFEGCGPDDSCEAPVPTTTAPPSAAPPTTATPQPAAQPTSYGGESVTWPRRPRGAAPPARGAVLTLGRVSRSDGGALAAGLLLPRVSATRVMTPCGDEVVVRGATRVVPPRGREPLVLLDPGHGGHADGTLAPDGTREAERVLQVSLEVERRLAGGPRVLLTRRADHDASLPYRVALADALRPDLSVSVHLDAAPETTRATPGTRVFGSVADPQGRRAAGVVHESLRRYLQGLTPRVGGRWASDRVVGALYRLGARGDYYGLLRRASTTWVIAEPMYLTDPEEARLLADPAVRSGLAGAYADGVRRFLAGAPGSGWAVPEPDPADPPPAPGQAVCTDPA